MLPSGAGLAAWMFVVQPLFSGKQVAGFPRASSHGMTSTGGHRRF
jgi:hypothetical protein